jgi:hypothetical protein
MMFSHTITVQFRLSQVSKGKSRGTARSANSITVSMKLRRSRSTKAALAAAKRRGVKFGGYRLHNDEGHA